MRRTFLSLENKMIAGFVSTSLVIIVALVSAWVARDLKRWGGWRQHSVEVLLQVHDVLSAVDTTDSARALYLATGDERELPPYFEGSAAFDDELKTLKDMVKNDLEQSRAVGELRRLADAALVDMDQEISQRGLQRDLLGVDLADDVEGLNLLEDLRLKAEEIKERELAFRDQRMANEERTSQRLLGVVLLGCVLATLLNISVQLSIRRDVLARESDARVIAEQRARLADAHGVLEQRVEALTSANRVIAERGHDLAAVRRDLEHKVKELDRSNRDLAQFAYVVSHDLKSPLRGISSLATWIEEDAATLSADAKQHLAMMRDRVARLEAMIEGILSYSRAGWTEATVTTTTLAAICEEVRTIIALPEGVTVVITVPPIELETINVQLQQVLLNLVGNAVRYGCVDGGVVEVSARDVDDDTVEISVRDDGPGIDARHHQRIFSLFQTLQPKDNAASTGIGLAVVKKLVDQHGGEIRLSSARGAGAAFIFTWPKRSPRRHPLHDVAATVDAAGIASDSRSTV